VRDGLQLAAATAALLAAAGAAPGSAATAQCSLQPLASVGMIGDGSGAIVIPVTLNGRDTAMMVDTGASWSGVVPSAVPGLRPFTSVQAAMGAGGGVSDQAVRVPHVQIGQFTFEHSDFMEMPESFSGDGRIGGVIGADILKRLDVEIDIAGRKVNLISKDHCPAKVVYWPHSDLVNIPLDVDLDGLLTAPVTLDGKELTALIDTGAAASLLRLNIAEEKLGLTPESSGVEKASTALTADGAHVQLYRHQFGTLAIGGVTFKNPIITLGDNKIFLHVGEEELRHRRPDDMLLGMHQLRQFHLYFAYTEGRLYATTIAGDAAAARALR
jgi:predicted aspartyl protease